MKRLIGFAAVVAILIGIFVAQHFSPQRQVKSLVARQVQLWNAGDIQGLYATFSPQMQAACPYPAFSALASQGAQQLGQAGSPDLSVKIRTVKVSGATATMTGSVSAGIVPLYTIPAMDPVRFVRTPSGWLLDSAGSAVDEGCTTGFLPSPP